MEVLWEDDGYWNNPTHAERKLIRELELCIPLEEPKPRRQKKTSKKDGSPESTPAPKSAPGRPRKNPVEDKPKRKRGRPKKDQDG